MITRVFLPVGGKDQEAVDKTLNLNEQTFLKNRRKNVKESEEAYFVALLETGLAPDEINTYIDERIYETKTPNDYKELKPYYFVSLFVLEQYKAI